MRSMGDAGHPHAKLLRSLDRGLKLPSLAYAAELGPASIPLEEALLLVLLLGDEPERFSRAAARWHARIVLEHPRTALPESAAILGLLQGLTGEKRAPAAVALATILRTYGMRRAPEKLELFAAGAWPAIVRSAPAVQKIR